MSSKTLVVKTLVVKTLVVKTLVVKTLVVKTPVTQPRIDAGCERAGGGLRWFVVAVISEHIL